MPFRRLDELPPPKTKLALKKHIRGVEPRLVAEVEYDERRQGRPKEAGRRALAPRREHAVALKAA